MGAEEPPFSKHAWEIRDAYRLRVLEDPQVTVDFRRFLQGRAWTHAEGRGALLTRARLRPNRVLLPGITVLTRPVTRVREEAADPRSGLVRRSALPTARATTRDDRGLLGMQPQPGPGGPVPDRGSAQRPHRHRKHRITAG